MYLSAAVQVSVLSTTKIIRYRWWRGRDPVLCRFGGFVFSFCKGLDVPGKRVAMQESQATAPDLGPVAGLGRASAVVGAGEIKREEKEDEENASAADPAEEEKKELKAPRARTRCQPPAPRAPRPAPMPAATAPPHCLPLAPGPPPP